MLIIEFRVQLGRAAKDLAGTSEMKTYLLNQKGYSRKIKAIGAVVVGLIFGVVIVGVTTVRNTSPQRSRRSCNHERNRSEKSDTETSSCCSSSENSTNRSETSNTYFLEAHEARIYAQNQRQCTFCLQCYEVGQKVRRLECLCLFHADGDCGIQTQKWIQERKVCPYCQHTLN